MEKRKRGRKPITDKKQQVSIYIQQSTIRYIGGIDKVKTKLNQYVDTIRHHMPVSDN